MTIATSASSGVATILDPLLADLYPTGVAFTHELTAAERDADVLAGDDDLALWTQLASESGGLALATGGRVRAAGIPDLPLRIAADRPAGRGLIGQALLGPPGWLAGFGPGDLLEVRLREGALTVRATTPSGDASGRVDAVVSACQQTVERAVERYADGYGKLPAVPITDVLLDLMRHRPHLFAAPLPPLALWLTPAHLEAFGGHVGLAGTPWNTTLTRDLPRPAVVAGMRVLTALLTGDQTPDADPGVLLRGLVSHAGAAGYLAAEIERRTANEGVCFTTGLDRLAAAAASPAQRAAVALCRARAAEGAGDPDTAQRLVIAALAEQPDLQPALLDAGEYAAYQGELAAAEEHLRRAAHPVAENLLGIIRSHRASQPAVGVGRNRPCACGSGRKAKLCCAATTVAPLRSRAELLYALIATYAQRTPAAERLGILITRSTGHPQHPLLCLDLLLTNEGHLRRFLHARGSWLREDERALLEVWGGIRIGAFEIRQVRRGHSVTVRTLPDGSPMVLHDRQLSTSVRYLDLFCGRILTDGQQPRMFPIPAMVSRERRHDLLTMLAANPSADQIAAFLGPQPDPCLLNSDGHEYFDAELTLEISDSEAVWQQLASDLTATDPDVLDHQIDRDGKTLSLGTITRHGQRFTLWANSRERLTALEQRVRDLVPTAREVGRRTERIGGQPPDDGRTARTLMIDSFLLPGQYASQEQAHTDLLLVTSRSWVDTTIDRLGTTPRDAATTGDDATRAELDALLDDMQWRNDRNLEQGKPITMDVAWIRQELTMPHHQP